MAWVCSAKGHVRFTPESDIVSDMAQQETPELSPESFPATYQIDQAACFRLLRQPYSITSSARASCDDGTVSRRHSEIS
jgi:hypothetical protein